MSITRTISNGFEKFSMIAIKTTGSSAAFIFAFLLVVIWGISGPIFHYSTTWQLSINTGTSIITFLMVFVLQQSQNKDTLALQLKVNELIASDENVSNKLINSEDLTKEELEVMKKIYERMGKTVKKNSKENGAVAKK